MQDSTAQDDMRNYNFNLLIMVIAGARQIFQKKLFLIIFIRKTSPGSEKKKFFMKNLPSASNNINTFIKYFTKSIAHVKKNSMSTNNVRTR
jgi:hypothetical protein